jgi:hypothetical protein
MGAGDKKSKVLLRRICLVLWRARGAIYLPSRWTDLLADIV